MGALTHSYWCVGVALAVDQVAHMLEHMCPNMPDKAWNSFAWCSIYMMQSKSITLSAFAGVLLNQLNFQGCLASSAPPLQPSNQRKVAFELGLLRVSWRFVA